MPSGSAHSRSRWAATCPAGSASPMPCRKRRTVVVASRPWQTARTAAGSTPLARARTVQAASTAPVEPTGVLPTSGTARQGQYGARTAQVTQAAQAAQVTQAVQAAQVTRTESCTH